MPPCKAQEKRISQSTLVGVLEPPVRGEVSSPLTPSAGPLFCKSSRGSFESVKPNRFSGLADPKPHTPSVCFTGATWATLFRASWFWDSLSCFFVESSRGNFKSVKPNRLSSLGVIWAPREISWLRFMVLGSPRSPKIKIPFVTSEVPHRGQILKTIHFTEIL